MMTFSAFSGGAVYWTWSGYRLVSLLATSWKLFVLQSTSAWVSCKDKFIMSSSTDFAGRSMSLVAQDWDDSYY
jgi:hypothetical protein